MGELRVGTCSWADKTMVKAWYPRGVSTAEERLRYYAARFDTVEVDSTFYGLPTPAVSELWAKRTPPGFVFHVKAYGLMTRHAVAEPSLPPELRDYDHTVTSSGKVTNPEPAMLDAAFGLFLDGVEPLRRAGKLGGLLVQFSYAFRADDPVERRRNLDYLDYVAERLGGETVLVEFRHPSWVQDVRLPETLRFLEDRDLHYVSVDSPQMPNHATMPPIAASTGGLAYVRFHGRNRETFFGKSASAADRFDYLYQPSELREWEGDLRRLTEETPVTYAMFNNCRNDYAPRNARELAEIMGDVVRRHEDGSLPGTAPEDGDEPEQLGLGL